MLKQAKLLLLFVLLVLLAFNSTAFGFSNRVKWSFKAESGFVGGVSANENYVFAGDANGNFYALNAGTGREIWINNDSSPIVGTPAIVNNNVIIARNDGTLTCLNASNGAVIWKHDSPHDASGSDSIPDGVAVGDGKIFVSKGDGKIYAINASNGSVLWTYKSNLELRSAPAYGENLVFLGEYDGVFSILEPKNGKRIGGGGAGGAINTLTIKNGNAYASSWDGSVQSFKIKGIIPSWNVKVGDPISTAPEVSEGKVLVGTERGFIAALDEKSGNILWNAQTNAGSISAKPIVFDNLVLVSCSRGLLVLDAGTGRERTLLFPDEGGSESRPAVFKGTFYVGFSSGNLYALN